MGFTPHVVEKDYVLGWLLWGVSTHEAIAESWAFKGGTCLKKCFFETYRFSEDLDFTVTEDRHLDEDFLRPAFADITQRVYEETGIEMPAQAQRFDIYPNPRGQLSCQARVAYRGPVSPRGSNMPRVKFDLTADEVLVLPPIRSRVFHPYRDEPAEGITIGSYAYEETFAEKVRALAERARPRDLYDVINLFRNVDARPSPALLVDVLGQKCAFKGIEIPDLAGLEPSRPLLEGGWQHMLAHQLPRLPPFAAFWEALPEFFRWLTTGKAPASPPPYQLLHGEQVIRTRTVAPVVPPAMTRYLDVIRFAASNRLCVDLSYLGSVRRIEPYSLRRTLEGNVVLHAHSRNKDAHRSYRLDRIEDAHVTAETFTPRFSIELTPRGSFPVPRTSHRTNPLSAPRFDLAQPASQRPVRPPQRRPRQRRHPSGPTYIYKCARCGRQFPRKTRYSTLKPHKNRHGRPCPGRFARFVRMRY